MTEREERIAEIRSWRSLFKEDFDFGEVQGRAEYSCWDDWLWTEEELALELHQEKPTKRHKAHRKPRITDQQRLAKRYKQVGYSAQISYDNREYLFYNPETKEVETHIPTYTYRKYYVSGRRKVAKWCTNRKVRHAKMIPKRPAGYRMLFDYDWTIW